MSGTETKRVKRRKEKLMSFLKQLGGVVHVNYVMRRLGLSHSQLYYVARGLDGGIEARLCGPSCYFVVDFRRLPFRGCERYYSLVDLYETVVSLGKRVVKIEDVAESIGCGDASPHPHMNATLDRLIRYIYPDAPVERRGGRRLYYVYGLRPRSIREVVASMPPCYARV